MGKGKVTGGEKDWHRDWNDRTTGRGWEGDRVAMVGRQGEKLVERRRMMTVEQLGGDGTKAWWHWQPEQRTDMIGRQRGAETQWRQRWSWRWQHRSAAAVAMTTTTAIAATIMV